VTVEDYVEGVSYQELLNLRRSQGKLFTPAEVNQLFAQIIPVLAFVHAQGINHGNLSLDHLIFEVYLP
jgi:serine/threonine-protein kinase